MDDSPAFSRERDELVNFPGLDTDGFNASGCCQVTAVGNEIRVLTWDRDGLKR